VFLNTLQTGDENSRHLRFLLYNCERQMTEICLLTQRVDFKHLITQYIKQQLQVMAAVGSKKKSDFTLN
jgi:NADPH-dependent 7-cyano-7-deazaguanine reductase QueF